MATTTTMAETSLSSDASTHSTSQHHRVSRTAGGRRQRSAIVKAPGLNRSITAPVGNPQSFSSQHQRFNRCKTVPNKQKEQEPQPEPEEETPKFRRSNTTFRSRLRQSNRQSITRMSLFGVQVASKRNLERMESTRDVDLADLDLGDIDLHESIQMGDGVNPEDTPEPRGSASSWIACLFGSKGSNGEQEKEKPNNSRESTSTVGSRWFGGPQQEKKERRESHSTTNTTIVANWPWSQHSRAEDSSMTASMTQHDDFGGDDHSFEDKPYERRTDHSLRGHQQAPQEKDAVKEFIEARLNTFWSNIDVLSGGYGLKYHVDYDDEEEGPPEEMDETSGSSSSHVSRLSQGHYGFTESYEARYNY